MKAIVLALREVTSDVAALLRFAPAIALLALAGEFQQHVAEIKLGMFASREAFTALQGSTIRLGFGAIKVAALLVAAFWAARKLAALRIETRPNLNGPVDWSRLMTAAVLTIVPLLAVLLAPIADPNVRLALLIAVMIAGIPASTIAMDALFGQARQSVRQSLRLRPLPPLFDIVTALPLAPAMYLHMQNHNWAFGAEPAVVWALMVWDSILVALMALLMGALVYRWYRPAPTP